MEPISPAAAEKGFTLGIWSTIEKLSHKIKCMQGSHQTTYNQHLIGYCQHGQSVTISRGVCKWCGVVTDECYCAHSWECLEHLTQLDKLGVAPKGKRNV